MNGYNLVRWCQRDLDSVRWENSVGPYSGQSGHWRFASQDDAQAFADYAGSEGAPAIDEASLREAKIPVPVQRIRG